MLKRRDSWTTLTPPPLRTADFFRVVKTTKKTIINQKVYTYIEKVQTRIVEIDLYIYIYILIIFPNTTIYFAIARAHVCVCVYAKCTISIIITIICTRSIYY